MKLVEKIIYSSITFLFVYIVISMAMRLFNITSTYNSHLIGGILAVMVAMGMFLYLVVKKKKS